MVICNAFVCGRGPPPPLTVSDCVCRCERKCRGVIVFAICTHLRTGTLDVSRLLGFIE